MKIRFSMIPRAVSALFRVVSGLLRRKKVLCTPAQTLDRLSMCEYCPYFIAESEQCDVCACFVRPKARLRTEDCPKGFWNP